MRHNSFSRDKLHRVYILPRDVEALNVLRDASNRIFLSTKLCARARWDLRCIHGVAEDDTVRVNRYLPMGGPAQGEPNGRRSTSFRMYVPICSLVGYRYHLAAFYRLLKTRREGLT